VQIKSCSNYTHSFSSGDESNLEYVWKRKEDWFKWVHCIMVLGGSIPFLHTVNAATFFLNKSFKTRVRTIPAITSILDT